MIGLLAHRRVGARALAPLALAVFAALLTPALAWAGNLLVSGHDADHHCNATGLQCHFVRVAADYVRAGAPDPSKPLLVLDNHGLEVPTALGRAYAPNPTPAMVVMDPAGAQFAAEPLDVARYSAIVIASDSSCGGCDLNQGTTADSDAINSRRDDIAGFFNEGGGIWANAGASHGNGPSGLAHLYYAFLPISATGAPVSPPFSLTSAGGALGFADPPGDTTASDINCCETHNSFAVPPPGSPLQPTESDSAGQAETLIGHGAAAGAGFHTPQLGVTAVVERVRGKIRIKRPGGRRFVALTGASDVPMGSTIDATRGRLRLTSARDLAGDTQSAIFYSGRFILRQARRERATTDLVLAGPAPRPCPASASATAAARRGGRGKRTLWGSGSGAFRTVGRYSAATVRGTTWLTEDRCTGTFTSVRSGVVSVFDQVLSKTVLVSAGHSYLARPRRRR